MVGPAAVRVNLFGHGWRGLIPELNVTRTVGWPYVLSDVDIRASREPERNPPSACPRPGRIRISAAVLLSR